MCVCVCVCVRVCVCAYMCVTPGPGGYVSIGKTDIDCSAPLHKEHNQLTVCYGLQGGVES